MATSLTLLNNVLRGLRRDALDATVTTDSYHLMLIQLLNQCKDQLEEQWDWHGLRTTVTVTLSASTVAYTLSDAGAADADVGVKSRLLYEKPSMYDGGMYEASDGETSSIRPGVLPQVFDVTESTEYRLTEISPERMERLHFTDNDETNKPTHFSLYRDADFMLMKVYPTPSGTRTLKMRFVIPQAEIPSTYMTGYTLTIPERPVWTKALLMAAEERGEDNGRPVSSLARDSEDALFIALQRERLDYFDNSGQPI